MISLHGMRATMNGRPNQQRKTESSQKQEGEEYQQKMERLDKTTTLRGEYEREENESGLQIGRGVEDKGYTKFTIQ